MKHNAKPMLPALLAACLFCGPALADAPKAAADKGVSQKSGDEATEADDLDVGPMPLAQRIVIVAVVICLIGAIAYYLAFMR